jgi:phospholipid N-methyltransferase
MNDSEKSSLTDKNEWNNICTEIVNNDNIFENFKVYFGSPMPICGVSKEDGLYYDKIFNNLPLSVISKMNNSKSELLKNDEKGSPEKINTNNFGEVCPQTMRYIYTLGELTELFGDLENLNILEIGGGYGGQAKVILSLFNISSYTVIDLKEACSLQKKYLSEYNNVHFVDGKDIDYESINRKFDLVISNYSFSELSLEYQQKYFEILKHIPNGYIIDNSQNHKQSGKFTRNGLELNKSIIEYNIENIKSYTTKTRLSTLYKNSEISPKTYYWRSNV